MFKQYKPESCYARRQDGTESTVKFQYQATYGKAFFFDKVMSAMLVSEGVLATYIMVLRLRAAAGEQQHRARQLATGKRCLGK